MEKWRQKLHIEPPKGWLNDPNGLCYFGGEYHVYFQYSPDSADGNSPRCWGHCHGKSLVDLVFDKIVLEPDFPDDKDGVYSGSAIVQDEIMHIFYTGNVKEKGDFDYINAGRCANVIHVTSENGSDMSAKKSILRNKDYPKFCSCHVRDPKVWKEDKLWYMVLGARTTEGEGCVLLYSSEDLVNWRYKNKIYIPDFGYMWECPDYFRIDKRGILSISPQGLPSHENSNQNVYQSGYFMVEGRLEENNLKEFHEWDMGFDFYAPQTFEAPDGRRIMIGWMGIGDSDYTNATIAMGWQHCLTLPRELTLMEDGRVLQNPIEEITKLRKNARSVLDGQTIESVLPFDMQGKALDYFAMDFDEKLHLSYDKKKGIFTMYFSDDDYGCGRTKRNAELKNCETVRIIVDMSSVEVYLNGGETVLSSRFYPANSKVKITVNGFEGTIWSMERRG